MAVLFKFLNSDMRLLAQLLYGTGMRLMEGLRLRIKDVDFDHQVIIVREAKGNKDRVVMLPRALEPALRKQSLHARSGEQDRQAQRSGVQTPPALDQKYPQIGNTWGWFWFFPLPTFSIDPHSGAERRHHLFEERLQRAITKAVAQTGICNACFSAYPGPPLLPRTCCNLAPIFAQYRSFSAITMCLPP